MQTISVTTAAYTVVVPQDPTNPVNNGITLNCDSSSGGANAAITITLPAISQFGNSPNFQIIINDVGGASATNSITVSCNASDKINNSASCIINQNGSSAVLEITGANDWVGILPQGGLPQVSITATADGLTTGTISNGNIFATVASANADHIVVLPAPIPGSRVNFYVGANGCELRSSSPTTIGINGGTGSAAESAIPANTYVEMMCVTATAWIGRQYNTAGVQSAVQVAAP